MTTPAGTRTQPRPTGPGPTAEHRPAPWVRTRLRSAALAALLAAALAFGTVFLAAAFPRAVDRGTDAALHEYLNGRGPVWTSMLATSARSYDAADLDRVAEKLGAYPNETFGFDTAGQVYGSRSNRPRMLLNEGLSRPEEKPPMADLLYLHGLTDHATLVAGHWPGPAADTGAIPIALSRSAADTIGIHLGDVLDAGAGSAVGDRPAERHLAEVVGLYTANDPNDPFWAEQPCPEKACLEGSPKYYWKTAGVIDAGSRGRIDAWGQGAKDFWRLPVDIAALRADRLQRTTEEISSYVSGPTSLQLRTRTGRPDLQLGSPLPQLFQQATARRDAAAPLAAIGPAGLAGVAAVVLLLAAALTFDRRNGELRLLRARGGSRGGVQRRLLGEGAVTVLPAAAAATVLALVLLPTARWTGAAVAALAATLLALLSFPVRAALLWSAPRRKSGRRRLVGELLVLAVTVAAVLEVRRRGVVPPGEGLDPVLVAAPLLIALTGGLLLARLQPVLVGALARLTGRGPGLIGFLGLARAARGTGGRPRPSVLPLLALMLAVTTAGFGSTVLDAVDGARLHAARQTVGGDAVVAAPIGVALPPSLTEAATALPGVKAGTTVWWESEVFLLGTDNGSTRVSVLAVDPQAYAELSRTVGRGEFDPAVLAGGGDGIDAPLPALFSSEVAAGAGDGSHRLRMPNGRELLATKVGTLGGTPALEESTRRFVVVPAGPAASGVPQVGKPNLWFGIGDVDERKLKAVVREHGPQGALDDLIAGRLGGGAAASQAPGTSVSAPASASGAASASASAGASATPPAPPGPPQAGQVPASAGSDNLPLGYVVHTSATREAELADDPLQKSAGRLFWASVIGAAGFALLAVLLTLLRAAPERVALLARLRTMGLRPRQGLALIIAETLPQTLIAAVGGGLSALAAAALLGPAIDLSALVGAPVRAGLQAAVLPVLVQVLGLAGLVCAGVLAEALISGRRQIATELRVGDQQ
ncbi:hypothetical protein ACIBJD_31785 [Kitasatospora sp. NPDC050467]|uniref:hypothetical protein n=1 Tax=Kitasatospora sp. NPDC050467 TaxID=3364053 RepID=UPI0037BB6F62